MHNVASVAIWRRRIMDGFFMSSSETKNSRRSTPGTPELQMGERRNLDLGRNSSTTSSLASSWTGCWRACPYAPASMKLERVLAPRADERVSERKLIPVAP